MLFRFLFSNLSRTLTRTSLVLVLNLAISLEARIALYNHFPSRKRLWRVSLVVLEREEESTLHSMTLQVIELRLSLVWSKVFLILDFLLLFILLYLQSNGLISFIYFQLFSCIIKVMMYNGREV